MTPVKLFPDDIHNQKTIQQGHPPSWVHCYPTQAEVLQRIALQYLSTSKTSVAAGL